jgi:hypothetical protein
MGWEIKIKLEKRATLYEIDPYFSFRDGRLNVRKRNQYKKIPEAMWMKKFTRW